MFNEALLVADQRQQSGTMCPTPHAAPAFQLAACRHGDERRDAAEAFIRRRFLRSHGASIATFMPELLLLEDAQDELRAATGYRRAAEEALFLERYLDAPVEEALTSRVSARVRRADIVEIGNFAASDSRHARILMSMLAPYLLERSARWIVFTATASIRTILAAMGARCLDLGPADGVHAAGGADDWGRYYSNDPRVMAGFLPSARRIPALWRPHHGN